MVFHVRRPRRTTPEGKPVSLGTLCGARETGLDWPWASRKNLEGWEDSSGRKALPCSVCQKIAVPHRAALDRKAF
jgi:hypothetical protein